MTPSYQAIRVLRTFVGDERWAALPHAKRRVACETATDYVALGSPLWLWELLLRWLAGAADEAVEGMRRDP